MDTMLPQRSCEGTIARRGSLRRFLSSLLSLPLIWQERYTQRRHLAELEPYMLKDMGLTKADVNEESLKPFWRD